MQCTGLPRCLSGEESAYQCGGHSFDFWVRKTPWSRRWQSTPVFLPRKSCGQRSLAGYVHRVARVRDDLATTQQQCEPIWEIEESWGRFSVTGPHSSLPFNFRSPTTSHSKDQRKLLSALSWWRRKVAIYPEQSVLSNKTCPQ